MQTKWNQKENIKTVNLFFYLKKVRKILFLCFYFLSFYTFWFAPVPKKPKLIVTIVVDQMRLDYFYRFLDQYGTDGFYRLLTQSAFTTETYYNYSPTYTAPGHASIYTGSIPQIHGIIANDWYSSEGRVYCVEDNGVQGVGTDRKDGKMSPKNLLADTFADALKLSNQFQSKVFSVSIKDRGAILPAGKTADAAYWFVGDEEGRFVSSTYYIKELPTWVEKFNQQKIPVYLDSTWQTLFPVGQYTQSRMDDYLHEIPFKGKEKAVLPYKIPDLYEQNKKFSMLYNTPFGNTLVKDFAKEIIVQEKLGQGKYPDLLAISFSSTDKIGHQFGIYSVETQDTYLRLDRDLADFLKFLDAQFGKDNYLLMLTADHGGMDIPTFLAEKKWNAGNTNERKIEPELQKVIEQKYGKGNWILDMSNFQIFVNKKLIKERKISYTEFENLIVEFLENYPHTAYVTTREQLRYQGSVIHQAIQNGFNIKRSGDIFYAFEPFWADTFNLGGGVGIAATHGSPYTYDTQIPLLFMGMGIVPERIDRRLEIQDGIVTLCNLLNIAKPNAAIGHNIYEVTQAFSKTKNERTKK